MLKCNVSVNAIFYARAVFRKQKTVLTDLCYLSFSIDKKFMKSFHIQLTSLYNGQI